MLRRGARCPQRLAARLAARIGDRLRRSPGTASRRFKANLTLLNSGYWRSWAQIVGYRRRLRRRLRILHRGEMVPQQHVQEAVASADPLQQHAFGGVVEEPLIPPWNMSSAPEDEAQREVLNARGARDERSDQADRQRVDDENLCPVRKRQGRTCESGRPTEVRQSEWQPDGNRGDRAEYKDVERRLPDALIRDGPLRDVRSRQAVQQTDHRSDDRGEKRHEGGGGHGCHRRGRQHNRRYVCHSKRNAHRGLDNVSKAAEHQQRRHTA